jgi:hypothetical protein
MDHQSKENDMKKHACYLPLIAALAIPLAGIATCPGIRTGWGFCRSTIHDARAAANDGAKMEGMQEHMLRMHELTHRIQDSEGAEREQLLAEQRELMREHMQTMRENMGQGMGPGMGQGMGPGMQQRGGGMAPPNQGQ